MKVCGLTTHYLDMGKGQPLVLLHGWGANSQAMLGLGRDLSALYRVIIPDLWGFGKSEQPADFDIHAYAKAVLELLNNLDIQKASFVGHSFGGRVALVIASLYPDRAERLVLIDSAGVRPRLSFKKRLQIRHYKKLKEQVRFGRLPPSVLEKFGSKDFRSLDNNMRKVFVRVVNEDLTPLLPKITTSTLILWGKKDKETPRYMAKVLHKNLKCSMLKWLNGGHFAYIDCQPQALRLIFDFLEA